MDEELTFDEILRRMCGQAELRAMLMAYFLNFSFLSVELINLRSDLEDLWDDSTAYPASLKTGKQCRSRGQCYVTALVIRKLYGGEVMRGIINGEPHFWNRIDTHEFDLTGDQYDGHEFEPVTKGKPVSDKKLNWNNRRFKRLWEKILTATFK